MARVRLRLRAVPAVAVARAGNEDATVTLLLPLQFGQQPPHHPALGQQGVFAFRQPVQRRLAQLEQSRRVAGAVEFLRHRLFLLRLQPRRRNLLYLEPQQIELLRIRLLIHHQRGLFAFQRVAPPDQPAKRLAFRLQPAKRVQNQQLPGRMQQRLMIVRPMHIYQPFADAAQRRQGSRRAIDELTVRARVGKRPFEHKLMLLARLQPVFLPIIFDRGAQFFNVEDRFHRTAFLPGPNQRPIRPFAQHQVQRPQNDRLARPGLARNDIAPRLKFKRQVTHQGEIFNAQRRQHAVNPGTTLRIAGPRANRKVTQIVLPPARAMKIMGEPKERERDTDNRRELKEHKEKNRNHHRLGVNLCVL